MATLAVMGEQYGNTYEDLCRIVGEDEADRLALMALKARRTIVQADGRETNSAAVLRREAMRLWAGVFSEDVRRKVDEAGELHPGKLLH